MNHHQRVERRVRQSVNRHVADVGMAASLSSVLTRMAAMEVQIEDLQERINMMALDLEAVMFSQKLRR